MKLFFFTISFLKTNYKNQYNNVMLFIILYFTTVTHKNKIKIIHNINNIYFIYIFLF